MTHDQTKQSTLLRQVVRGALQSGSASIVVMALGLFRAIVMARLLAPDDFGLFSLALVFFELASQVEHVGAASAYIHFSDRSAENKDTFFSLRILLGLGALFLSLALWPVLEALYPERVQLPVVVVVLAAINLVGAFNNVGMTFLREQLRFKRLSVLDVLGAALATGMGIVFALSGFGLWSLVASHASPYLVKFCGVWLFRPPAKRSFRLSRHWRGRYFSFAKGYFLGQNLDFVLDRFDDFFVGSFISPASLGFYSRAFTFANYPRRVLEAPLTHVAMPAFAKLQGDLPRISQVFEKVTALVFRGAILGVVPLFLVAADLIDLVLGQKWLPMTGAFRGLLLYTTTLPLILVARNLTYALGMPLIFTWAQCARTIVSVLAVVLCGVSWGVDGVALAVAGSSIVGLLLLWWLLRPHLEGVAWGAALVPPLISGVLSFLGAGMLSRTASLSRGAHLVLVVAASASLYLAGLFILERGRYLLPGTRWAAAE